MATESEAAEGVLEVKDKGCCSWRKFRGVRKAQGYAFAGVGNGSIAISNVFLSTAFIFLASKEVGCFDETTGKTTACDVRVHGFLPAAIVTNVAVIAGLLAAFSLPVIGAVIDYTSHRRTVGRIVGFLIWLIQTVQIFTSEKNWFPMVVLQAIVVALFEIHYSLMVSYLPDIARYEVDHDTMTRFNRIFFCLQYAGQVSCLLVCLTVSFIFKFTSVNSARLGQSISSVVLLLFWSQAWQRLPQMEGPHKLPEGKSLLLQGFRQNFKTVKILLQSPNRTLKWFFLTVIISESGGTSLLPVVVSFYSRVLRYNSLDVGLTFLVAVLAAIPGALMNTYLCSRWNPKVSLRFNFCFLFSITIIAPFVVTAENPRWMGYLFGVFWGFSLGWMYSGEQLFYTLCMPESQETEFAGFFVYCTVILTWLPSLIYSTIVENGYKEQYGLGSLCVLQLISFATIAMVPDWEEVIEGSKIKLLAPQETQELPRSISSSSSTDMNNAEEPDKRSEITQETPSDFPNTKDGDGDGDGDDDDNNHADMKSA